MSQWTLRWLLEHDMDDDMTMYNCSTIEDAVGLLDSALIFGESPALIVFDHADRPTEENLKFSEQLHNAIPESWVIELVPDSMPVPLTQNGQFYIRKPVKENEWNETLDLVLLRDCSPQWANT